MYKIVFILLLAVTVASCQDNKSKSTNPLKTEKNEEVNSTKNSKPKPKPDVRSYQNPWDTITKLTQEEFIPFMTQYGKENPETKVLIQTDFGDIEVELYTDTPLHRANFIYMTKLDYFNTTYFYRVDKGFVIQAGNSDNLNTGSMRKRIGDFLIPKEFNPNYRHHYGAFAAAKFTEQNVSKASSPFEFYIVMDKDGAHHLDDEHTVFGRVTKGMEVAEKISRVKTENNSEWPVDNVEITVRVR